MEDRATIQRAIAGDPAAERALFDGHLARVHRLIFRMTGDPDLTDELVQETFVRAFDRLATFRFEARLSTWLSRIAVSVTLNALAAAKRRERGRRELQMELRMERQIERQAVAAAADDPLVLARIERALRTLPDASRAVVAMCMEGYSHEEIARATGTSIAASKTRLSRARERLREMLPDVLEELRR